MFDNTLIFSNLTKEEKKKQIKDINKIENHKVTTVKQYK